MAAPPADAAGAAGAAGRAAEPVGAAGQVRGAAGADGLPVAETATASLIPVMTQICGAGGVVSDPRDLATYECDGLTSHRTAPGLVVLPETAEQVAAVVRACARAGVPFVARGSGTGLSGGALPRSDGVLVVTSRMRKILEIDPLSRRAIVEPGVTNLSVSKAVEPYGFFYAPDPSSQVICSVGGNVAENSGGAHCLKHGFTVHHVTGLEIVTPDGELVWLGDGTGASPGYDLLGAFTGSEGTLGIATKIVVKLTPLPEAVTCLLAAFDSTSQGGTAVSSIIGEGIVPAAIEMMDALAIEAAEAAVHCNYPEGAGAVLVVELDGPAADVEKDRAAVRELCEQAGAGEIRIADDPAERARIWAGRKSAFAAVGRISPAYIVQDGVVPRTACRECWRGSPSCPPGRTACGWPTSSTPATATCTRWSCSTTASRARARRPRKFPARSWTSASRRAGRSPASTASASTSRAT